MKLLPTIATLLVGVMLSLGHDDQSACAAPAGQFAGQSPGSAQPGSAVRSLLGSAQNPQVASGPLGSQVFATAPDSITKTPHPAVARIIAPGKGTVSYGSCTLIDANEKFGLVITNWHVINEATGPITVLFPDGFSSIGTIQKVDRDWDLAAIAIYKPYAKPVAMAASAPRPGEQLTIAGYGSGAYRAASGPCTQYVAPGVKFPYEMVELAASARQGDSGGPIFNSHGELAGVLFGEGQGRTSGSYCGRVQWFLTSVASPRRQGQPAPGNVAAQARAPGVSGAQANSGRAPSSAVASNTPAASHTMNRPESTGRFDAEARLTPIAPMSSDARVVQHYAAPTAAAPVARIEAAGGDLRAPVAPLAASSVVTTQYVGWHDMAGDTTGEQIKTVLAAIGALALVLQTVRWLATSSG